MRSIPHRFNEYTYDYLDADCIAEAAGIVAAGFVEKEPLTKYLGVSLLEMQQLCETYIEQVMQDGLCIACKTQTGRVVAATLCRDLTTDINLLGLSAKLDPIFALLEELVGKYFTTDKLQSLNRGEVVEIFATAVSPEVFQQGLGKELIKVAAQAFKEKGYGCSVTESTSPITQQIRIKNGFELLASIAYKEFECMGEKVFREIDLSEYKMKEFLFKDNNPGAALLVQYF